MAAPEPAPEKKVKLERESQTLCTCCQVCPADEHWNAAQIKSVDMVRYLGTESQGLLLMHLQERGHATRSH